MILGFDVDGVLYPWHEEAWKWYLNHKKKSISFIDFWKYPNGLVATLEGSPIVKEMVSAILPYISAPHNNVDASIVSSLANVVSKIYYITSRPHHVAYDTQKWLADSGFPQADNLIMADKNGGKFAVVKDVKCDYYVEDRPKYLETLPAITYVFQMIRPYNTYKVFDAHKVGNLYEVYDVLTQNYGRTI